MNNLHPNLSNQPVRPYTGMVSPLIPNQYYNGPPATEAITLGIPLLPNNVPKMPAHANPSVHLPHNSQQAHNYVQLPQQQVNHSTSPYYTSHNPTQHQISNIRDQNSGYIELTDSSVSEPMYAPSETRKEETTMISDAVMPSIQYPQLPGPMALPNIQYPQLSGPMTPSQPYQMTHGAERSGPIVYDLNLLQGITSRESQLCHCQHCDKYVQTVVYYKAGKGAILSGVFLGCLGGLPLLCSWVPCVIKDFKDAIHYCPVCAQVIGTKKFMVN